MEPSIRGKEISKRALFFTAPANYEADTSGKTDDVALWGLPNVSARENGRNGHMFGCLVFVNKDCCICASETPVQFGLTCKDRRFEIFFLLNSLWLNRQDL